MMREMGTGQRNKHPWLGIRDRPCKDLWVQVGSQNINNPNFACPLGTIALDLLCRNISNNWNNGSVCEPSWIKEGVFSVNFKEIVEFVG